MRCLLGNAQCLDSYQMLNVPSTDCNVATLNFHGTGFVQQNDRLCGVQTNNGPDSIIKYQGQDRFGTGRAVLTHGLIRGYFIREISLLGSVASVLVVDCEERVAGRGGGRVGVSCEVGRCVADRSSRYAHAGAV
jgi:hypothetical protein